MQTLSHQFAVPCQMHEAHTHIHTTQSALSVTIIYIDSRLPQCMSLGMDGHSLLWSSEDEIMCLFIAAAGA